MRLPFISRRAVVSLAATLLLSPAWAQSPAPIKLALIEGLSGPFGNTGEAVVRNIAWAVERVNARGGVKTAQGMRPMVLERYDSKGQSEEALSALKSMIACHRPIMPTCNKSSFSAPIRK